MSRLNVNNLLCVLLAAVLVVLALAASPVSANAETYKFLMEFRSAFKMLQGYWPADNSTSDYCTWEYMNCFNDTVSIALINKGVQGTLPVLSEDYSTIGDKIMVTDVSLSVNSKVKGTLSANWKYLTNLRSFSIDQTSVGGTLPQEWENMGLTHFNAYRSSLCGSLPNWNMPNLTWFDVANSTMGGSLSASWSGMTKLENVYLKGNGFCGCVPESWASNSVLTTAAKDLPAAVRASDCASKNKCGKLDRCKSAASGVASLVASVAAIAAVAAAMVL